MPAAPLPKNETQRLEALRRYRILDTPPEPAFDDFVEIASVIADTPIATISLIDEHRQWFKAKFGFESLPDESRDSAFCAHAILTPDMLIVEDAERDGRFSDNPLVTGQPGIRFYAGVPLIDGEGHGLGTLCVIDQRPRRLGREQLDALQALGRRVREHFDLRMVADRLAVTLDELRTLQGMLPICSHCKSIRNDDGYWSSVESYMKAHSSVDFSHGICPVCLEKHHPEVFARMRAQGRI